MRKFIGLTAASALALGAGFWAANTVDAADVATSDITMQGQVANTCGFLSGPVPSNTNNASLTDATVGTPIVTFDLADATTANLKASTIRLTFGGMCNYSPTTLSLKSTKGGLIAGSAPALPISGFLTRIDYTATAQWGTASAGFTTDGSLPIVSNSSAVNSPRNVNLVLNIMIDAATTPVIAGTYTDTLTVQLGTPL
jgi:hypothetical protein